MDLQSTLEQVFSSNFLTYYKSHVAHVNLVGPNFPQYHGLLGGIYEDLQDDIDVLAELLRTIRAYMPANLGTVIALATELDEMVDGDQFELLEIVYDSVESLIEDYRSLYDAAESERNIQISNFAQDRILKLEKHCWMLRSTLEGAERMGPEERGERY